jgi:hypothetical protein
VELPYCAVIGCHYLPYIGIETITTASGCGGCPAARGLHPAAPSASEDFILPALMAHEVLVIGIARYRVTI